MKLNKIVLNNFRILRGSNELLISRESTQPLTLIIGNNGTGKTTVLKGIQWALYGEEDYRERLQNVNTLALREGEEVFVDLNFDYDGSTYVLRRQIPVQRGSLTAKPDTVDLVADGVPVPREYVQSKIEAMLPKDASQFYFFDGEKIEAYVRDLGWIETKKAITLVLGLEEIQRAKEHLEGLSAELTRSISKELAKHSDLEGLARELDEAQNEFEGLQQEREQLKKQITVDEARIRELEVAVKENETVREKAKLVEQKKGQVRQAEESINDIEAKVTRGNERAYLRVLSSRITMLVSHTQAQLADLDMKRERMLQNIGTVIAYEKVLADPKCICGRPMDEQHRKQIQARILSIPEERGMLEQLERRRVELSDHLQVLTQAQVETKQVRGELETLQLEREKAEQLREKLRVEITDGEREIFSVGDLKKLEESLTIARRDSYVDTKSLSEREEKAETARLRVNEVRAKIDKLKVDDQRLSILKAQQKLVGTLSSASGELHFETYKAKRSRIESEATRIFKLITNKELDYDGLYLDDDFRFGIAARDGTKPPMAHVSPGEKQVAALSFILGLNRYAGHKAPIIMDTPMGRLDNTHRENMAQRLREVGEQIVLLVTDSDLNGPPGEIFRKGAGKTFTLDYKGLYDSHVQDVS